MLKFMNMARYASSYGIVALSDTTTTVGWDDISSVITSIQSQISVSTVISVLAAGVGVCIGLVFMWWVVRKGVRMIMDAFRSGSLSV